MDNRPRLGSMFELKLYSVAEYFALIKYFFLGWQLNKFKNCLGKKSYKINLKQLQ